VSIVRAVTVGSLVGAAAALGIYASMGPDDMGRAAVPAPPTFAPVPTPTVTRLADCTPPAVLTKGVCVTTKPGPKVTVAAPAPRSATTTSARTTAPVAAEERDDDEHEDDGDDEHEDEHEDEDDD
jgi:hypothetical protein